MYYVYDLRLDGFSWGVCKMIEALTFREGLMGAADTQIARETERLRFGGLV